MIITFDGRAGTGKTTYSRKVAELLDLPIVSNFFARQVLLNFFRVSAGSIKPGLDFSDALLELLIFHRTRIGSKKHPTDFVLDDGLFSVLFSYHKHDDFDNILDFFLQSFRLSSVPPPNFSFYLYVKSESLTKRKIYRSLNTDKFVVKNVDLGATDTLSDLDDEWIEFWRSMEKRIPNFYAVDATQSEERVMEDIVSILEDGGVFNG